jgi:hypothetical protein
MSSADRTGPIAVIAWWLRTQSYRHGFALVAVCVAVAAQPGLEVEIGLAHSFLLFYPTILIVSLLAGFWAGVTATLQHDQAHGAHEQRFHPCRTACGAF